MKFPPLKGFAKFISPVSLAINHSSGIIAIFVLFQPSGFEFFWGIIVADGLAFAVVNVLAEKLFLKLFPQARYFFNAVDAQAIAQFSFNEKKDLLREMLLFPKRYAQFIYYGSFIKAIPAYIAIVFFWQHEISHFAQLAIAFLFSAMNNSYFYGCALYDSQERISQHIAELHLKHDLSEEIGVLNIPEYEQKLQYQEYLTQLFIVVFILSLQSAVVISNEFADHFQLTFKLIVIASVGMVLSLRIWYISQKDLSEGLSNVLNKLNLIDFNTKLIALPLHANPVVAKFEKAFNLLLKRIETNEVTIRELIYQTSEKSRYQALGEISALVAHDLSAPMHVIQYCLSELKEKNLNTSCENYLHQMQINVEQSIDLIMALRAKLKSSPYSEQFTLFTDAHNHTIRLLETQFGSPFSHQVSIHFDPQLKDYKIAIPRMDLMQILDNIYRNCIKNLVESKINNPRLGVQIKKVDSQKIFVAVLDNGTGMTQKEFKGFTEFSATPNLQPNYSNSLGLKLTRRLIEQYGGTLSVSDPEQRDEKSGTEFILELPLLINRSI